ncbi:hypothetical protein Salat_1216500 [Sesamum alatum]|uniref:Myb/SANT-like domain-containing protein n=1 Tax=Sesamum alatum TaxID=300844 RepID=A0AAE1YGH9_9LAMI|nr:hypothetical protein Salat_1216500 [Sesamum alatum]
MADQPPPLRRSTRSTDRANKAQSLYFQTYRWSRKHDNTFIRMLYQQDLRDHKQNVIKKRLEQLWKRYDTFHRIIHTPGFMWNCRNNEIDFANAYRYQGEPARNELSTIFAPDEADQDVHRIFDVSTGEEENFDEDSDGEDSGDEDNG